MNELQGAWRRTTDIEKVKSHHRGDCWWGHQIHTENYTSIWTETT